jgi:NAD(P)H dehydrogenase (quinone)
MTILVTGATGHFGSLVAESLLARGLANQLAVSVRSPAKAQALKQRGVEVRHGDFDDLASLVSAFRGVERILIVSTDGDNETRIRQHKTAVQAAQQAGVKYIAYTSIANAPHNTLGLAEVHRATEEAITATGIPHAFLRNNWYLENELGFVQAALAGAPIRTSAGQGRVGWALRADYAQAAAAVLAGSQRSSQIYELSGPLATYDDFAAALGQVLGHPVAVDHVSDASYGEGLAGSGLPAFLVPLFVGFASQIRANALAVESNDLATLLGRPATPLVAALQQLVTALPSQAK